MKKITFALAMITVMVFGLSGCAGTNVADTKKAPEYTIKKSGLTFPQATQSLRSFAHSGTPLR